MDDEISIATMIPRSVCADTKTGWLWYCDVCDEHGHADSRRKASALSSAHESADGENEHDLYVWEAGATRVWDASQGEGRNSPWKRNWQVRMHSRLDGTTRTLSFKTEDEALEKAYDYVRSGGEAASAFVLDKTASHDHFGTETEVLWWEGELIAFANPAFADVAEAEERRRVALDGIFTRRGPFAGPRIARLVDET